MKALNGSGRAPQALTIDYLRSRGLKGNSIPLEDLNSVTVPGAAAAWIDTVRLHGSGNVTFAEVMESAIRFAEEGYVPRTAHLSHRRKILHSVPVHELNSHAVSRVNLRIPVRVR